MALTRTVIPDSEDIWGKHRTVVQLLTLDSSYATGGYSLTPAQIGWSQIDGVEVLGGNSTAGGYHFHYDYVNKKLMAFLSAGFTPAGTVAAPTFTGTALAAHRHVLHFQTSAAANAVTAATNSLRTAAAAFDVAGVGNSSGEGGIVDVTAGTPAGTNSAPAFTGTAVAAGVMSEVANATDLSAVKVRVRFTGI